MGFEDFLEGFRNRHPGWFASNEQGCDLSHPASPGVSQAKMAASPRPGPELVPLEAAHQPDLKLDWAEVAQVDDADEAEVDI